MDLPEPPLREQHRDRVVHLAQAGVNLLADHVIARLAERFAP